jgi:DNA-binding XRE family transcriptional regulator
MTSLNIVRRRQLLTGDELAAKAKVSKSTVFSIERGKHQPTMRVVRQLAQALGVQPEEVDEFRAVLGLPATEDLPGRHEAAAA